MAQTRNRFQHKITIYVRTQKTSNTGKTYWGFEPVALGKGRKPTGSYYLRHVDQNGKQKWVPAGQSFAEADELKEQLGAEKTAESSGLTIESRDRLLGCTTVNDAVAAFMKAKEHKRPRTLQAYSLTLKCFSDTLPNRVRNVEDITEDTVRHFADHMTAAGLSPKTVKNRVLHVSFLLKHVGSKVKTRWSELPTVEKQPVKAFTPDELKKLMQEADEEEHATFSFFLATGCREQEVSHAEWSDVDFAHRLHTVQAKPEWEFVPKSHEARSIPLPAELVDMLRERKKQSESKLIFPNRDGKPNGHFLRMLKRVAYRAGLNCGHCMAKADRVKKRSCKNHAVCEQWYLHRFRKTFATKMHHAGLPLKDLQTVLGHKSLTTTQLYLADSDMKAAHVRAVADKAFSF
jgi:integrase/recombinase XerD